MFDIYLIIKCTISRPLASKAYSNAEKGITVTILGAISQAGVKILTKEITGCICVQEAKSQ